MERLFPHFLHVNYLWMLKTKPVYLLFFFPGGKQDVTKDHGI